MVRRVSRGAWVEGPPEAPGVCPTLGLDRASVTHIMETPGQHSHSSLEAATPLPHSSRRVLAAAWAAVRMGG